VPRAERPDQTTGGDDLGIVFIGERHWLEIAFYTVEGSPCKVSPTADNTNKPNTSDRQIDRDQASSRPTDQPTNKQIDYYIRTRQTTSLSPSFLSPTPPRSVRTTLCLSLVVERRHKPRQPSRIEQKPQRPTLIDRERKHSTYRYNKDNSRPPFTMTTSMRPSIPVMAALAVLFALAVTTANAQIYYDGPIRFYHAPGASYCYINAAASYGPFTCVAKPDLADAGIFTLTGVNVPWKTYVESPTTPAILNGGALSKWCLPRNYTGNTPNSIYCSGSGLTPWFQIVKVGGLGSNYIYNGDTVVIRSTLTNTNCTLDNNVVNCNPTTLPGTVFTIVI
jgi:hypothetical protein